MAILNVNYLHVLWSPNFSLCHDHWWIALLVLFVYTDSHLFLSYHADPCVSSMYVTGNLFLLGLKVMLDVCVNMLSRSVMSDPL